MTTTSAGGGITGCFSGLLLQWFTNAFDGGFILHGYPFMVSGKPTFSLAIYIPVVFELTVLFSALACFGGMLALNNLPLLYHPVFRSARFARATDDRFFISIEATAFTAIERGKKIEIDPVKKPATPILPMTSALRICAFSIATSPAETRRFIIVRKTSLVALTMQRPMS